MKKLILSLALSLLSTLIFAQGKVHVSGYTKKNGTYVAPHDRTKPNRTETDNWSSKPNYNPETGKRGTKTPKK